MRKPIPVAESVQDSMLRSAGFDPRLSPSWPGDETLSPACAIVLHALDLCERNFAFIGGCTLTDRPGIPRSPQTYWKMNFAPQLAAIADARAAVREVLVARTDPGCAGCSTSLPSAPCIGTQARPVAFTDLEDGRVIVEVGDAQLALSVEEFSILRALLCAHPRRKR